MPRRRNGVWTLMVCIAFLSCAESVCGQGEQKNSAAQRPADSATAQRKYVAAIGQFRRSGVYEIASSGSSLVGLVERFGGLTNQASGGVRILRNGRSVFQAFYSPRSQVMVLPGDLVIAGTRSTHGVRTVAKAIPRGASSETKAVSQKKLVEITLLDLIDRPVVLKVRPKHASLSTLLSLLGQKGGRTSRVRVLHPVGQNGYRTQTLGGRLSSGSILVFDSRFVQRDRIPPLPQPYLLETRSAGLTRPTSSQPSVKSPPEKRSSPGKKTQRVFTASDRRTVPMRNSNRANPVDADERKLREKRSVQKLLMEAR
ncbi:MAG: hypothetical protein IID45_16115, partial [Planctomycetes bacterium]|nr:hypothetical protein [Planctomycetota bacterium]